MTAIYNADRHGIMATTTWGVRPMSITIADDQLVATLAEAGDPVEITTREGRVLGVFTPKPMPPEPNISEEELNHLLADPTAKWYTAAEVETKMREWRCSQ